MEAKPGCHRRRFPTAFMRQAHAQVSSSIKSPAWSAASGGAATKQRSQDIIREVFKPVLPLAAFTTLASPDLFYEPCFFISKITDPSRFLQCMTGKLRTRPSEK